MTLLQYAVHIVDKMSPEVSAALLGELSNLDSVVRSTCLFLSHCFYFCFKQPGAEFEERQTQISCKNACQLSLKQPEAM